MTLEEITEWAQSLFKDIPIGNKKFLDLSFFSQYIPDFGMRFNVEMILRSEPKNIYIAIASLNPPGALYQDKPEFEKAVLFTQINWESKMSAQ